MTTTEFMPAVEVSAPALIPYPFGLFSVVAPSPVEGRALSGSWWRSQACGLLGVTYTPCVVDDDVPALDPNVTCQVPESRAVFTVYARSDESMGGEPLAAKYARARELLLAGEQYAVETILWAAMVADVTTTITWPGASIVDAVAAAEGALAPAGYGGTPTIHMDRVTATRAHEVLHATGGKLSTLLGSTVVAGGGYGPWNSTSGVGAMFVTGAVVAQRGEIVDLGETHDRATNSISAVVERTYSIGWDCSAAKITFDTIA